MILMKVFYITTISYITTWKIEVSPVDDEHFFALHHVFTVENNRQLNVWSNTWNTHRLRTVSTTLHKPYGLQENYKTLLALMNNQIWICLRIPLKKKHPGKMRDQYFFPSLLYSKINVCKD